MNFDDSISLLISGKCPFLKKKKEEEEQTNFPIYIIHTVYQKLKYNKTKKVKIIRIHSGKRIRNYKGIKFIILYDSRNYINLFAY